jgi:hypothetical protein
MNHQIRVSALPATVMSPMRLIAAMLAILVISSGCGDGSTFLVERHQITKGSYDGLTIGMDKAAALAVAKALGADVASPFPCMWFSVSQKNLRELPKLTDVEGLRLFGGQLILVDIFLSDGRVSKIYEFPAAHIASPVNIGDDAADVRAKIVALVNLRSDAHVQPIVPRFDDTLHLDSSSQMDEKTLKAHQCWDFELPTVKPAGAFYELTFNDQKLTKISYRRPRIRLDL